MKVKHVLKLLIAVAFIFVSARESRACHALDIINFTLTQTASGVEVDGQSTSPTCGCDEYWLDIEIRCVNIAFDGAPFDPTQYLGLNTYPYFQSAQMLKPSCVVQSYPTTTIPYSSLCPGVDYKVRVRENNNGNAGPWTTALTFTAPGTMDPLVIDISATETSVCPGDCTTLTANVTGGCGLQPEYTWSNGATTQSITVCPGATTTYTVDVYEICTELTASASQTITVGGIIDMTCPPGLTAVCDISEQPPYPDYNAFQAAGGSVTLDPSATLDEPTFNLVSEVSDGNTCPETITRTYEIADDCGVYVSCTQTIVIDDNVNPSGTAPAPVTVQCIGDVPAADPTLITDEADNCSSPTVTHVGDASDGNTCPETITRTYRIEDACGNFIDVNQTITVDDDTNPNGTAPADATVACFGDVPAVNVNDVTGVSDNCTTNPTVTHVGDVNLGGACPFDIERTYRIEDDCGNFTDVVQTITVNDNVDPTGTAPTPVSVQCAGDVPAADINDVTGVSDNCTANPVVTHVGDVSDGNTCPETITRTYRIEDDCGNFIEVDQTITVNDDTDPTGTAPAPVAVQCIGDVPAADPTLITDEADNCTATPTVTHVGDVSDGNTCPETITRTYRIEDDCGNFIEVDQTITVDDDTAPTASNPATTTVECATDVPATDPTVVTDEADNCTANPTVTFVSEVSDNNVCNGEQLTRTYEIEDDCGNTTTVTHTIIIDSYTPTFSVAGTDPTQCGATDGFITVSGLDPNTDYEFSYNGGGTSVITTDGAGEYVITGLGSGSYTGFTVSDADCPSCSTTDGSTITLVDPNPPAVDAGPDQQVCEGSTVTLTADNPDGANITWDNGITDGTAFTPAVGTTTYTVTADLVGCTSTDQVDVTVAPTIDALTCPGGLTAVCDISEQPAYADFDAFIADGGSATIPAGGEIDSTSFTLLSEVSDGNTCPETVTRTYQIADTCGVTVTCTQTIVINDLIDPTGTAPAPVSVQCIGDVPAADPTLITDEADNCSTPTVTHVGDVSDGNTCPETITRTYRIEDACGNFIEVDQTITVNDDTDPTGTAPAPVTVQCIGDVPAADPALITDEADNCTAAPTVTHVGDVSDGNTCPETITRTYRIEDDCGNFIEVDQTITVDDDTDPTASNPATTTVACASDVPAADPTVVTDEADNCTANPTVTFISETSDNNVCNGEELTRIYEIEDDCGNTTTVTHTIIIDAFDPVYTVAGTDPTQCGANDGFITVSGLDPNTDYDISYNGNAAVTATTDANGEYVITGLTAGSYTDFTINPVSCPLCQVVDNTNINLVDPNAPPVDAGPDQEVCEGTQVTLTADNPNGANISWDNGVTDGTAFTPAVGTTNYTVTAEEAGCTSTDLVIVTVNPIPNVNAGNDVAICDGDQVTLSGSGAATYAWDNGVTDGVAFTPTATTTYTVTGTSAEGCVNTDDVTVTVYDNPDISFTADNTVGCIPQEVSFSNTTGANSATCEWNIGGTTITDSCNPSYTFTNAGCYDVTLIVTNTDGCTSTSTEQNFVCIDDYPTADFYADPAELTSLYNETDFINNSVGASTYEWDFGDGNGSTEENPSHEYPGEEENEFLVQLIATSQYGCQDTAYQTVLMREELLFYVPNTFTPDNDDFNETFKPVFTSGFDPMEYTLLIYDRWGEVIFESNNSDIGWDGTYGAHSKDIVKDGTYVWKIIFKTKYEDERKVEVGHVNVLK